MQAPSRSDSSAKFTKKAVVARLNSALLQLSERDDVLFQVDANERSLTHKLAEYLAHHFPNWDVDCEYNRNGGSPKRLLKRASERHSLFDNDAQTVFPDIIVHRRGTSKNLLVIEVKKDTNKEGTNWDEQKLDAYKNDPDGHRYKFAALVTLHMGIEAIRRFSVEWK